MCVCVCGVCGVCVCVGVCVWCVCVCVWCVCDSVCVCVCVWCGVCVWCVCVCVVCVCVWVWVWVIVKGGYNACTIVKSCIHLHGPYNNNMQWSSHVFVSGG